MLDSRPDGVSFQNFRRIENLSGLQRNPDAGLGGWRESQPISVSRPGTTENANRSSSKEAAPRDCPACYSLLGRFCKAGHPVSSWAALLKWRVPSWVMLSRTVSSQCPLLTWFSERGLHGDFLGFWGILLLLGQSPRQKGSTVLQWYRAQDGNRK